MTPRAPSHRGHRTRLAPRVVLLGATVAFGVGLASAWAYRRGVHGASPAAEKTDLQSPDGSDARDSRAATSPAPRAPSKAAIAQADARFQAGLEALRTGRNDSALTLFTDASKLDPSDPRPHHGLGLVYRERVLHDRAAQAFARAAELDPADPWSRFELARELHDLARYDEALAILEALMRRRPGDRPGPSNPTIRSAMARELLALARPAEALPHLEAFRAAEGDSAWTLAHLGRAHAALGRTKDAEESYRQALALDPFYASAWFWLGEALKAAGREDEATRALVRFRELRELQTRSHSLRMAIIRDPENVAALVDLAEARARLGQLDEAAELLDRAIEIAPDDRRIGAAREFVRNELARRQPRSDATR
ncbi:MAG TPA: tetratricopeptide repeat protein [Planctomycetota bacterium]|nr:tetratricopeptide repeat protein [Planctomycetota bacterium]